MQRWLGRSPLRAGDDDFMSARVLARIISANFVVEQSRLAFQNGFCPLVELLRNFQGNF